MNRVRYILVLITYLLISGPHSFATNYTCATATPIAVNPDNSCSVNVNGTTVGATADGLAACSGSAANTVWYSFVAISASQTITVTGGSIDPVIELYGSCGGARIVCTDVNSTGAGEVQTYASYVPGNTYYVRIYDFRGAGQSHAFNICVSAWNDACTAAITLTSNSTCVTTSGSNVGAAQSPGALCSTGGSTASDVWYTFVAQSTNPSITVAPSGFDAVIELRTTPCGGSTIQCRDNVGYNASETMTTAGLTIGTTYAIRVHNYDNNWGTFTICVVDPCSAPTTQATNIAFSSVQCTQMTVSWTNGNGADRIVVAKATSAIAGTPANGTVYTANTTFGSGGTIAAGEYVVYNGTGSSVTVTGLSPGTTYNFRVYELNCPGGPYYKTTVGTGNPGSQATNPLPVAPAAPTGTTSLCNTSTGITYTVAAVAGATSYSWSYSGTGFSITSGSTTNTITASFTAATSGNLTVYALNACGTGSVSPALAITTNNTPPTTAVAGPDQFICASPATLAGNAPAVGTGTWTLLNPTGSPALITTPSSNTSTVTAIPASAYVTLRWTISNGGCGSSYSDVVIRTQ